MKNTIIDICAAKIQPGEAANLALALPEKFSCTPLYMPIKVINGINKGPCLVIFSTLEGSELNGIEIVNRIVELTRSEQINGTVIAIPVVNVYGLTHFPAATPSGKDLADCFPGTEDGTFGERVAHVFTQEILKKADYCIELQTGGLNHNILPQVYCNFGNSDSKKLAKAFQAPVVTNVSLEGNLLRQTTENLQIPLLVYQAGEAMRFDENAINLGVNGVRNIMKAIDILPKQSATDVKPIFSQDEEWIVSHAGGILHSSVTLGQVIKKNDVLGNISDPFGTNKSEVIRSPMDGVLVGINSTPLVHEGLPVFKIASFLDDDKAENIIEQWDKTQTDSFLE